jgi:photosystem I P700 chlorophyll a apoprotein A1
MMNHHLAGLLGLGCLGWAGHQIHISLPVNALLDKGVAVKDIPLPHEYLFDTNWMAQLYSRCSSSWPVTCTGPTGASATA